MKSKSQNRKSVKGKRKTRRNPKKKHLRRKSWVTPGHRLSKMKIKQEKMIRNKVQKQKTKWKQMERSRKRKTVKTGKTGAQYSFRSFSSSCVKIFRNVSGSLVASKTNRMNVASLPQKRKHPVIMPYKKSFMKWRKRRLMKRYRKKFSNIFKRN